MVSMKNEPLVKVLSVPKHELKAAKNGMNLLKTIQRDAINKSHEKLFQTESGFLLDLGSIPRGNIINLSQMCYRKYTHLSNSIKMQHSTTKKTLSFPFQFLPLWDRVNR